MSFTPPQSLSVDLTPILNLLEINAACCETNTKYLFAINDRLNRYDSIFRRLIDCCERMNYGDTGVPLPTPGPVKPVLPPGQTYEPPGVISPSPAPSPTPVREVKAYVVEPIREVNRKEYDTPFYPHASVIGIAGKFNIVGDTYVGPDGVDLRKWLPLSLNYKNDNLILEAIIDYRVITLNDMYKTKSVAIVYQTYDDRTGVRKTFEGSSTLYKSWWEIHSGVREQKVSAVSARSFQRGVID
jgi:hypothetical protein